MRDRIRTFLFEHRNAAMFIAALACGLVAVFAGHRYLAARLEAERLRLAPTPPRMVDVVVARRDLAKGDLVSADTMALRKIPADYVASGAVRPEQFDGFAGMRLGQALRSGEALLVGAVVGGDHLAFSARVKPGIRALTIAVDEINSISGMLQPGDRIDLLFSARPPDGSRAQALEATVPLFQNLLVLATGRQVRAGVEERGGARGFSTVTVEVEPDHAQRLVVAQRAGKLTAVLRNPDDHARLARKAIDIRQLLGVAEPAAPVVWRGPQIIVGGVGRLGAEGGRMPADAGAGRTLAATSERPDPTDRHAVDTGAVLTTAESAREAAPAAGQASVFPVARSSGREAVDGRRRP